MWVPYQIGSRESHLQHILDIELPALGQFSQFNLCPWWWSALSWKTKPFHNWSTTLMQSHLLCNKFSDMIQP